MKWPESEARKLPPEGHYSFRVNREPELKKVTFKDKEGNDKEGRKIIFYAVGINDTGEYPISDGFFPWESRYEELLAALGVEHGKDIQVTGAYFTADIKHQPDKKDPTKVYPRLANIQGQGDVPASNVPDDDIPF
jgi:hypothetical protein